MDCLVTSLMWFHHCQHSKPPRNYEKIRDFFFGTLLTDVLFRVISNSHLSNPLANPLTMIQLNRGFV